MPVLITVLITNSDDNKMIGGSVQMQTSDHVPVMITVLITNSADNGMIGIGADPDTRPRASADPDNRHDASAENKL